MKLTLGITSCTPEWQLLLSQIGVPSSTVDLSAASDLSHLPSIIVSSKLTASEKLNALEYLSSGGTILTEADTAQILFSIKTRLQQVWLIHRKCKC